MQASNAKKHQLISAPKSTRTNTHTSNMTKAIWIYITRKLTQPKRNHCAFEPCLQLFFWSLTPMIALCKTTLFDRPDKRTLYANLGWAWPLWGNDFDHSISCKPQKRLVWGRHIWPLSWEIGIVTFAIGEAASVSWLNWPCRITSTKQRRHQRYLDSAGQATLGRSRSHERNWCWSWPHKRNWRWSSPHKRSWSWSWPEFRTNWWAKETVALWILQRLFSSYNPITSAS